MGPRATILPISLYHHHCPVYLIQRPVTGPNPRAERRKRNGWLRVKIPLMKISGDLADGLFARRLNRFAAEIEVEGQFALAHVPNSGRMRELLVPGARVLLVARSGSRKTAFDLVMVAHEERWLGLDARLPVYLLEEALHSGLVDLGPFHSIRREVPFGDSRLDLLGVGSGAPCLIEVKSVNLVRDGVALFPDASTSRGTRHLLELRRAVAEGYSASVVFVVQRDDAHCLRPFEAADPLFASTLRGVAPYVQALAYACEVTRGCIRIIRGIPVEL